MKKAIIVLVAAFVTAVSSADSMTIANSRSDGGGSTIGTTKGFSPAPVLVCYNVLGMVFCSTR